MGVAGSRATAGSDDDATARSAPGAASTAGASGVRNAHAANPPITTPAPIIARIVRGKLPFFAGGFALGRGPIASSGTPPGRDIVATASRPNGADRRVGALVGDGARRERLGSASTFTHLFADGGLDDLGDLALRRHPVMRSGAGLERVGEGRHGLEALRRILREGPFEDRIEGPQRRVHRRRGVRRAREDVTERLGVVRTPEQQFARQSLPGHDGQGVLIAAGVEGATFNVLGRHIAELSLDDVARRGLEVARNLGDAEIGEAGMAVEADEHVLRRHVAMDDAHRLTGNVFHTVRGGEAARDVEEDTDGHARRDRAVRVAAVLQQLRERPAVDVVEDERELMPDELDVQDGDDVRVMDHRRDARFVLEPLPQGGVLEDEGVWPLDGYEPREADGSTEPADEDRGHAAARDLGDDLVARGGLVARPEGFWLQLARLVHWPARLPWPRFASLACRRPWVRPRGRSGMSPPAALLAA